MTMIETRQLTRRFGKTVAVDALNLRIEKGDTFGFIGPNGAGKTTTIQMLATLLRPSSGSILIDGMPLKGNAQEVRQMIGYMPDAAVSYEGLTVREYLQFFAAAYGIGGAQRRRVVDDVVALTDLQGKLDSAVQSLSRGTRQRLGLARVLLHDPELLLLDEPASGLDPRARIEIREILKELGRLGKTIFISSHILSDLAELCTTVGIIEHGRLVTAGAMGDVVATVRAGSTLRLAVDSGREQVVELLRRHEAVTGVVSENGYLRVVMRDGGCGPAEIASLLVSNGHRLTHLELEEAGLEEAFMKLTRGIVS
jgi:ABC-2 type transport system ATP-binding protein